MEMSPNQVRTATFASARKGFDPTEVTAFLDRAAESLEAAQNHATAMEARARAAVAKLQELSAGGAAVSSPSNAASTPHPEADTISRTLLLAQRAADDAIAEARAEAERLVAEAREAARTAGSNEREQVRSEVDALAARREFLQSDVEQLENFLLDQRERLRNAAASLVEVAERVPDGLGYIRPPLLSASDDASDPDAPLELHFDATADEAVAENDAAVANGDAVEHDAAVASDDPDATETERGSEDRLEPSDEQGASATDATEALPVIVLSDEDESPSSGTERDSSDDPTPTSTRLGSGAAADRGPFGRGGRPGPSGGSGR